MPCTGPPAQGLKSGPVRPPPGNGTFLTLLSHERRNLDRPLTEQRKSEVPKTSLEPQNLFFPWSSLLPNRGPQWAWRTGGGLWGLRSFGPTWCPWGHAHSHLTSRSHSGLLKFFCRCSFFCSRFISMGPLEGPLTDKCALRLDRPALSPRPRRLFGSSWADGAMTSFSVGC